MSTKLCKADVLRRKGIFIFLVNKDILVPSLVWGGIHLQSGLSVVGCGLMSFSGSSCADGRGYCCQMLVIAPLLGGSAPSDPQVELFFQCSALPPLLPGHASLEQKVKMNSLF